MVLTKILTISAIVIAVVFGVLYAVPKTRPFVKKYWWLFLAGIATALGSALFVRGAGKDSGYDPTKVDKAVATARTNAKIAEVEAKIQQTQAEERYSVVKQDLDEAKAIEDPFERHKRLCQIYEAIR